MTLTTIKVSTDLRDRLRTAAAARGRTLGEQIEAMLDDSARAERLARLREQLAANPPDEQYLADAAEWQADRW